MLFKKTTTKLLRETGRVTKISRNMQKTLTAGKGGSIHKDCSEYFSGYRGK